jgi:hypothetical protein
MCFVAIMGARVFITLGDRGWWRNVGWDGVPAAEVSVNVERIVYTLSRCGCTSPGAVFHEESAARVEFISGDLRHLTLTITSTHATNAPWVFTGAFVDMGSGIHPPDGLRQLRAISAFLTTLEFQNG